jgi:hypothetical protein
MRLSIEDMENNLHDAWEQITPQDLFNGVAWYPAAHDLAFTIGHGDVRKGAGLLAALSPNKAWDTNKRLAVDAGNGIFGGHVGNALLKAQVIYAGADPATVLPMGKKTGHFYKNIYTPLNPDWVTIDRHMIRALKSCWDDGEPRITLREYGDCVLATQKAAANVGLVPSVFQAAIWEWARREFKG